MANNIELVIKISEEEYARIQSMDWKNGDRFYDEAERAIHYGKPLEEVLGEIKGEIEELIDWHDCPIEYDNGNDAWYREACNMAISIIDSHISGKGIECY